ncbi:BRO family protein (plasmid) [Nonomuraea sp. CA-143628]|uniref:BRO family protein n=1 Tax=Nonomuraea sp. CA-143628 TaxID=3239997 RepID=UPI003D8F7653
MLQEIQPSGAESPFDAIKHINEDGERWSSREMMPHLDYEQWRQFADAIDRAKAAASNVGANIQDHFADARKITVNSRGARREIDDVTLTRYGAYLVAMNCDPRKPAVAAAQTYFATKTREAEIRAQIPSPPQTAEIFTPKTFPLAEVVVLIKQRFGVRISVADLKEKLRQAGAVRQDDRPRAKYEALFWHTGEAGKAYEVFGHQIEAVYRLYETTKLRLEIATQRALPMDPPGWPELPLGGEA